MCSTSWVGNELGFLVGSWFCCFFNGITSKWVGNVLGWKRVGLANELGWKRLGLETSWVINKSKQNNNGLGGGRSPDKGRFCRGLGRVSTIYLPSRMRARVKDTGVYSSVLHVCLRSAEDTVVAAVCKRTCILLIFSKGYSGSSLYEIYMVNRIVIE